MEDRLALTLVGVDFAFGDPSPANWNVFDLPITTLPDLIREDGQVTTMALTVVDDDGVGFGTLGTIPASELPAHTQSLEHLQDYLFELDDPLTLTFSGLAPLASYDIYVFGHRFAANTQQVSITGSGTPTTFTQAHAAEGLAINDEPGSSLRSLRSYAITVAASATGTVEIIVEPVTAAAIGGVAIEEFVPSGDFDHDGAFECDDVDALVAEIVAGTHALRFDLNGDGDVDHLDLDEWLVLAGAVPGSPTAGNAFLPADANLNGVVDGEDFLIWNANKFTSGPGFCSADFNADGVVDGQDFLTWNAHKFLSADVARTGELDRSAVRADVASINADGLTEVTAPVGTGTATTAHDFPLKLLNRSTEQWVEKTRHGAVRVEPVAKQSVLLSRSENDSHDVDRDRGTLADLVLSATDAWMPPARHDSQFKA